MSLEEFYTATGSDLPGVRARLLTDERIEKFVNIFFADPTFEELSDAIAEGDNARAFRAAHTLKGISRDVGLTRVNEAADRLTEALRPGDDGAPTSPELAPGLYAQVCEVYNQAVAAFNSTGLGGQRN